MKLTALIVDDEPLARERIRGLLASDSDVVVIGECASGAEAVQAIRAKRPDLLFLDVQMPGMDGFETLAAVHADAGDAIPAVVFVTAYDQFAVRAFEVHALDYLLKPFDRERFAAALRRAKADVERAQSGEMTARLTALLEGRRPQSPYLRRLVVNGAGRILVVDVADIRWIESEGNYVRLHTTADAHLHRETMKALEARLDPEEFLRIHRSIIVRIDRVKELRPWFHGAYIVVLSDGTELSSSRGFSARLKTVFRGD
jgi:two-component system, LytTR family, response regulator